MSWAEWPFCIYTLNNNVYTAGDDQVRTIKSVPQQTVTRLPGLKTLDIILPRRWGESNPTSKPAALSQTLLVPNFGPVATANYAANLAIDVNFVGGPTISRPLTDYLYSWALSFDTVVIKQYLGRMGATIGVKEALNVVHDINMALCQVIPKMTVSNGEPIDVYRGPLLDDDTITAENFTTSVALDYCYTSHMEVSPAKIDPETSLAWPIAGQTSADYRIFATNATVWNKVVLGLAKADNIASERLTDLPVWYGNPNCFFWELLTAIPHCIAWSIYYSTLGMTTLAWNTGYTTSQSQWIQEVVRATYCTQQRSGTVLPARFGNLILRIFQSMFDRSVASTISSVGVKPVNITVFDRWLPGNNYASCYDRAGTGFSGLCPVLLPDVWIQYMSDNTPKFAMSFPRPFSTDSTQGYGESAGFVVHRTNSNNQVSVYIKQPLAFYPVREGPLITDEEMFNNRLAFTEPTRTILTMVGQPAANTTIPPGGFYPSGRNITLSPGEVYPPQLTNAATLCIPYINHEALRLIVFLPQAIANRVLRACNRSQRLERPAWLLGNVFIAPDLQYLSNYNDPRFKMTEEDSDFRGAPEQKVVMAPIEDVRAQAVDPVALPSAVTPSAPMTQPAEPVTSLI